MNEKPEEVYLCASEDFKEKGEDKTALDVYYEAEHLPDERPLDFCIRQGLGTYIWQMLIVDFLILNRDRHGANIEVLRNKRRKIVRLAPLFDHGLSLLFRCATREAVEKFDVMEDRPIQSFVGSRSAWQNLELIPKGKLPQLNPLLEKDKAFLLDGLEDVMPLYLRDKIWEMIWKRWCRFDSLKTGRFPFVRCAADNQCGGGVADSKLFQAVYKRVGENRETTSD